MKFNLLHSVKCATLYVGESPPCSGLFFTDYRKYTFATPKPPTISTCHHLILHHFFVLIHSEYTQMKLKSVS